MSKKVIKYLIILFTFIIIFILNGNEAKAATASLSGNQTVTKGQSVTVTASVTAGAWNLTLSGGGQTAKLVGDTDIVGNKTASTSITFVANENTTVTLTGDMTDFSAESSETVNKSIQITVQEPETGGETEVPSNPETPEEPDTPETPSTPTNPQTPSNPTTTPKPDTTTETKKSTVATLSNLGIRPNDFTGFTPSKKEYTVTVPNDVETIEVYANKGQSAQTITGTGEKTLQVGENRFEVNVTAEDGKTKATYVVTVNREEVTENEEEEEPVDLENPEEFGLTELKIEGITLDPEFSTNIYEYTAKLKDDKSMLEIETVASEENAKIEITGNENLQNGENTITILVTNEAGDKTAAYQITVDKDVVDEEALTQQANIEKLEKQRTTILIGGSVVLVILIIIAVIIIRNRRKSYVDEYSVPYSNLNDDEENSGAYDENYDNVYDNNYNNEMQEDEENENIEDNNERYSNFDENGEFKGYKKITDKFNQEPYKNTFEDENYDENQNFDYNDDYDEDKRRHKRGKRFK